MNTTSDTPRTDALWQIKEDSHIGELWTISRQLERELNAANERIKRLEEAGDRLASVTLRNGASHDDWRQAKEAKP